MLSDVREFIYFQGTMKYSSFNHSMLLHVDKNLSDDLNLTTCANDIALKNEHRIKLW